ncbi:MAG: hypothetical protein K8L97_01560 [Anaerolineae bacterium]|nr:hypothetical protein [Anaerolineae bacterium]
MSGNYRRNGRRGGLANKRQHLVLRLLLADEIKAPVRWQNEPQLYPIGWRAEAQWFGQAASVEIIATRCELPMGSRDPAKPLPRSYEIQMRAGGVVMRRWLSQTEVLAKFPPPLKIVAPTPIIEEPPFNPEEDTQRDIRVYPIDVPKDEPDKSIEEFQIEEGVL